VSPESPESREVSEAERQAIRAIAKVEKACRAGEITKDEALRQIAALVAADEQRKP